MNTEQPTIDQILIEFVSKSYQPSSRDEAKHKLLDHLLSLPALQVSPLYETPSGRLTRKITANEDERLVIRQALTTAILGEEQPRAKD
jgi:hypothetical protein